MAEAKKTVAAKKIVAEKKAVAEKAPVKKAAPKIADKPVASHTSKKEKVAVMQNSTYATGKRKNSIARVYIALGKGVITVNGKPMTEYFKRKVLQLIVNQPFTISNTIGRYDVRAVTTGGGLSGQAGAVKHGISKALQIADSSLRATLKKAGFLTRDSRVVERKHYGHHKARRSTQFSKR